MRLQKRLVPKTALMLFATICACAAGGKKIYEVPKNATGGAMSDVKVMRLGTLETGEISDGPTGSEGIVSTPIVLWQKNGTPAEVILLHYKTSLLTFHVTQRFKRVMSEGGPFTITHRALFTFNEKGPDVYSKHIYTADLDGNGTEELILTRVRGGVEAYSLEKKLFSLNLPQEFQPKNGVKARIGNRDVVFLMFGNDDAEKDQQKWMVVRVDKKGAVRLPIGNANNLPGSELVAVAPINRPGSSAVDELVVVSARPSKFSIDSSTKKSLVRVSRYNVDGKLLYTPREIELPDVRLSFSARSPINISFLPHSEKLVLFDADGPNIYFIDPQQQRNWIRTVDLQPVTSPSFVQVVDSKNPKVILRSENRFFAIDEMGKSFSWDGKFVAQKDLLPFLEIKAPSNIGDERINVLPLDNGSPEMLVVRTRKKTEQIPEYKEIRKIAAQYLGEEYVTSQFQDVKLSSDGEIDEKSMDDFSFSSRITLYDLATAVKKQKNLPEHEKLKAWLKTTEIPAKTIVKYYRGSELNDIQTVRGHADGYSNDSVLLPCMNARKFGNKIRMIVVLSPTGETGPGDSEMGGIFLLEWQEK